VIYCLRQMVTIKLLKNTFDSSLGNLKVGQIKAVPEAVADRWIKKGIARKNEGVIDDGRKAKQGNSQRYEVKAEQKVAFDSKVEDIQEEAIAEAVSEETESETALDLMSDEDLRKLGKDLKIRSAHNMGIELLKKKIRAVSEF